MKSYQVLVSSPNYHGHEALTYSSEQAYDIGSVVIVPLRQSNVLGLVIGTARKPTFKIKPISRLVVEQPLPTPLLELLHWLQSYYPSPWGLITQLFLPSSLLGQKNNLLAPRPIYPGLKDLKHLPTLTSDQSGSLNAIRSPSKSTTFLLHGATGTGKTRVYLELALASLQAGRSVLLLTPEIGLTPQLEQTFNEQFGARVVLIHSNLTPAQRRAAWLQILTATEPLVVIGPRSALFSPLANIGLIVIDEAHDQAYKQENAPYYQALRVAAQLSRLHGAKLILGSATPPVSEYWLAETKGVPILTMQTQPAGVHIDRQVQVVNLRDPSQFGARPHLSKPLLRAISQALEKNQQSLVFLNRRGTARLVLCRLCGWQALCPHCDLPLTYHGDTYNIRCHSCSYQHAAYTTCQECGSNDIVFKSVGTKSIVAELQKEFPDAHIKRFDADNLTADRLAANYQDIHAGKVDILVGTQMLAKGLDLPKLAVVGVVIADTSLYFPDYTAEERTYQLLSQVIGRVGRGHLTGHVIVQTYNPTSPTLAAAIDGDWQTFYEAQLQERQTYHFPPFYHVLKLICSRASADSAARAAKRLSSQLQKRQLPIIIDGPAPCFHEKNAGQYRWQLIIKAKQRSQLLSVIHDLPSGWTHDIDPSQLL